MDERDSHIHKNRLHRVLVHSYIVYFFLFLVGVVLDMIFDFHLFYNTFIAYLGLVLIFFGTILIFWAQRTSHTAFGKNHNDIEQEITKEIFYRGPYVYTKSPTHWGLFFLILGFGFMTDALFVVVLTIVAFVITQFVFLDKREEILEEKYGEHYKEYKNLLKF